MNLLFKDAVSADYNPNTWNNSESRFGCFELSEENKILMNDYEQKILEFISSDKKSFNIVMPNEYVKKTFFSGHGVAKKFKCLDMKADKQNPLLILFKKSKNKVPQYVPDNNLLDDLENPEFSETFKKHKNEPSVTTIIKALLSKKVPLIGHNLILDLAFLYDHFLSPLPSTIEEFRLTVLNTFPPLYDTKYISKSLMSGLKFIKKTSVEDLYSYCRKRKEFNTIIKITIDSRFNVAKKAHDAGFDAYMTGHIFLCFLKYLPSPAEILPAAGKICLQGHYKDFIDINQPNIENFAFPNVIKVVSNLNISLKALAKDMAKYADNFIIQEDVNTFFIEFFQIDNKIDEVVFDINQTQGFRAFKLNISETN